jgi:hypothetical protein
MPGQSHLIFQQKNLATNYAKYAKKKTDSPETTRIVPDAKTAKKTRLFLAVPLAA